ncbi:sugar transferase [Frigidibacter sp. MR17.14]|uniref:sugar transferase n=1 Tax=Frigidibacter sp. MR17.14 TaxID=3126509 RepID=UPI003012B064
MQPDFARSQLASPEKPSYSRDICAPEVSARSAREPSKTSVEGGFYGAAGKRLFDISLALIMLPILAPTILILLILASMDGGWPMFRHRRIGRNGETFGCLKIRSMVVDADVRLARLLESDPAAAAEWALSQKLTDDPRITAFGQFIRKTSLDELPQVWNVLMGEMSFVGPRPIVRDEMIRYGMSIGAYLQMRPGLTGPWQASGRNDMSYDERVTLDVEYSRSFGFAKDVKIILATGMAVLKRTGK